MHRVQNSKRLPKCSKYIDGRLGLWTCFVHSPWNFVSSASTVSAILIATVRPPVDLKSVSLLNNKMTDSPGRLPK